MGEVVATGVLFRWFLILNNIFLEKMLILWKNDTSYHISSQSIGILRQNDTGLGKKKFTETEMNITVAKELYGQHMHDLLQSMEERFTGQGSIFY